ncbi:MAG: polymorphic toxin type 44 domain-containing protein [Janthinobacterium lividum]|uniref:polymorphic toxin type 44 domain-containing protein n=1 Tax=Pseudomonas sp. MWU16-30317 TaxID=2878095 RepID=UPI001CF9AE7D|nr:polymorphic toxin type 44 domain-containing protein [Pseudomonas sp. MWU16-30317]
MNIPESPPNVSVDINMRFSSWQRAYFRNGGDAFLFSWFYTKVRNGGEWDYKKVNRCYEAFGNFNYGACGTAAGMSPSVLLRGAGWAQSRAGTRESQNGFWWLNAPYGDDPKDQEWIKEGISYAKAKGF